MIQLFEHFRVWRFFAAFVISLLGFAIGAYLVITDQNEATRLFASNLMTFIAGTWLGVSGKNNSSSQHQSLPVYGSVSDANSMGTHTPPSSPEHS